VSAALRPPPLRYGFRTAALTQGVTLLQKSKCHPCADEKVLPMYRNVQGERLDPAFIPTLGWC